MLAKIVAYTPTRPSEKPADSEWMFWVKVILIVLVAVGLGIFAGSVLGAMNRSSSPAHQIHRRDNGPANLVVRMGNLGGSAQDVRLLKTTAGPLVYGNIRPTGTQNNQGFAALFDQGGHFQWARKLNSNGDRQIVCAAETTNGLHLFGNEFQHFNSGDYSDIFHLRLSKNGTVLSSQLFGDSYVYVSETARDCTYLPESNQLALVGGRRYPNQYPQGLIMRLNATSGGLDDYQTIGTHQLDQSFTLTAVAAEGEGSVVVGGEFLGSRYDFKPQIFTFHHRPETPVARFTMFTPPGATGQLAGLIQTPSGSLGAGSTQYSSFGALFSENGFNGTDVSNSMALTGFKSIRNRPGGGFGALGFTGDGDSILTSRNGSTPNYYAQMRVPNGVSVQDIEFNDLDTLVYSGIGSDGSVVLGNFSLAQPALSDGCAFPREFALPRFTGAGAFSAPFFSIGFPSGLISTTLAPDVSVPSWTITTGCLPINGGESGSSRADVLPKILMGIFIPIGVIGGVVLGYVGYRRNWFRVWFDGCRGCFSPDPRPVPVPLPGPGPTTRPVPDPARIGPLTAWPRPAPTQYNPHPDVPLRVLTHPSDGVSEIGEF